MSDKTGISWTDATWNPVRGCSRVSEGCRNCYAERTAARFCDPGQPYAGLIRRGIGGDRIGWSGEVRMVPEHLADPLRWSKPRRVFVNSMSDLFHEKLTNEQIAAVFGVMAACPRHTFQVLTKRARRMREWFEWLARGDDGSQNTSEDIAHYIDDGACAELAGHFDCCHLGLTTSKFAWPLTNVWLGVSIENQEAADERIPKLLATPAAVRFLSCEPLLGPVDLGCQDHVMRWLRPDSLGVSWVIAGCESGPGARPCDVAWLRSLRDQCAAAGVPYFLKQATHTIEPGNYPTVGVNRIDVVGAGPGSKRKPSGVIELPYLDGVQHKEFPNANAAFPVAR